MAAHAVVDGAGKLHFVGGLGWTLEQFGRATLTDFASAMAARDRTRPDATSLTPSDARRIARQINEKMKTS